MAIINDKPDELLQALKLADEIMRKAEEGRIKVVEEEAVKAEWIDLGGEG